MRTRRGAIKSRGVQIMSNRPLLCRRMFGPIRYSMNDNGEPCRPFSEARSFLLRTSAAPPCRRAGYMLVT